MESRNLMKALDIMSVLMTGGSVGAKSEQGLYEEYCTNSEVYDILTSICKKLNINLYEYNNTIFISAGDDNRVFGYSNEELKKVMGLRLNRELFLVYFIIYNTITVFYRESSVSTYLEYVRVEDIIKSVDAAFAGVMDPSSIVSRNYGEQETFKSLSLLWDELPVVSTEDKNGMRAAKNSKSGYIKITFNFMISQNLLAESGEKFYPTDRFRAIAENYFEQNRSRLYDIMNGRKEETDYAAD